MFSVITLLLISKANNAILEDPYNVLLRDNTDYKIEESILEEDYELSDRVTAGLHTSDSSARARIATDSSDNQVTRAQKKYFHASTSTAPSTKYWYYKKEKPRKYISINNGTDYTLISYEDFLKIYVVTTNNEDKKFNQSGEGGKITPNSTDILQSMKALLTFDNCCKNCSEEELKHIGFRALCCLLGDYQKGQPPRVIAARLWRIVKIWALVYLCVALPLWCMKGWCCCCLCCKFFKPRQTIEEAKCYFVRNPPGVLKVHCNELQYEPSENERDAYEEFEHLLRTI